MVWGINQQLEIYRSANSGQTWEKVTGAAQGISAVSENVAWTVNQGNEWKTNDGGKTWSFSAEKMKSISAHDFYIAWGIDESGALRHTIDGKTWNKVTDGYFYSCHTLNDYTAYAVDNNLKLVTMKYYGEEKAAAQHPVATTASAEEKKGKLTGNETIDALLQGKKAGEKSDTYGLLSIFNQSGYVASVALTYTEAGNLVTKNEQITLGFTKQYQLPIGATNIVLKVEGVACVDGLGMDVKFATAKDLQKCYKLWGTIFSTEWGGIACN